MLDSLDILIRNLKKADSVIRKIQILDEDRSIDIFLNSHPLIKKITKDYPPEYEFIIKSLIVIDQASNILYNLENTPDYDTLLKNLCKNLLNIDEFYKPLGGIIGYHNKFLTLLKGKDQKQDVKFLEPEYIDLRKDCRAINELTKLGLKNLDNFALICPMGGAGERLNLYDPKTNEAMPAAKLNFRGKSLAENLIDDIQALEHLYWQTYKKRVQMPIVIMTSDCKNNHKHIVSIFENNNYFKRDKNNFYFIKQISVPLISQNGNWALEAPLKLALRPSGHGALWRLMEKTKAFDFLKNHKKDKAIIRQINNPIAGTDYLLLSFMGAAIKKKKSFGFISCERKKGCKEGINVLKEEQRDHSYYYNFSNIEYTDFKKHKLEDLSDIQKTDSKFFANTNILFADLNAVQKASYLNPFPALTINLKTKVFLKDRNGKIIEIKAARLESMMQNIADYIKDKKSDKIKKEAQQNLKTFISLSDRSKTLSSTKKAYVEGSDFADTPQMCFYDVLCNYLDLLKNHCQMKMPQMPSKNEYLLTGPSFITNFNPIIGPLYTDISKKIITGQLISGSEMQLEIAQVLLQNIYLNGSLIIETDLISDEKNYYNSSKCTLDNVTIKNLGIDKSAKNIYWQNKIIRKEYLKISLGTNSEFYAKDIEFINTHEIIVPSFHKMFILRKKDKIIYKIDKI